jgi:hypothetical protein
MNQKNIFTVIGAILVLQGFAFYFMGDKMMADVFPNLDEAGNYATTNLAQVMAMMSITVGLISYAARNTSQVLWAFTIGFGLFGLNSLKHMFINHINVPIPALVIQLGIALVCGYLWMQSGKTQAS